MENKHKYATITGIVLLLPIAVYFYNAGSETTPIETPQKQQHIDAGVPISLDTTSTENQTENDLSQLPPTSPEKAQKSSPVATPAQGDAATNLSDEINNLLSPLETKSQIQKAITLIEQYDSPEATEIFLAYLIDNQNIPDELQKALTDQLNNMTDRERVTSLIADNFINLTDSAIREKLLAINQPESLEKISQFALEQGDTETYDKAVEQIKSNPSEHTFEALMSMSQSDYSAYTDQEFFLPPEVIASEWAYQQLSGSRLDFIELKLEAGEYSSEEKQFILLILGASEDQVRGNELIKKFWGEKEANS